MQTQSDTKHLRLGRRDLDVLSTVHDTLCLSTSQIAEMYFPSVKKASERLKMLTKAGLLTCQKRHWVFNEPKTEFFFRLTKPGVRQLAASGRSHDRSAAVARNSFPANLEHLSATNQFSVLLHSACTVRNHLSQLFEPSWRLLARRSGNTSGSGLGSALTKTIKPDAAFSLSRESEASLLFFLEVDLGSEPFHRRQTQGQSSLLEKVTLYGNYFDSGEYVPDAKKLFMHNFKGFRLLLAARDWGRIHTLRGHMESRGDTHYIWASTFDDIATEGVFGKIWEIVFRGETNRYSIIEHYDHPASTQGESQ